MWWCERCQRVLTAAAGVLSDHGVELSLDDVKALRSAFRIRSGRVSAPVSSSVEEVTEVDYNRLANYLVGPPSVSNAVLLSVDRDAASREREHALSMRRSVEMKPDLVAASGDYEGDAALWASIGAAGGESLGSWLRTVRS